MMLSATEETAPTDVPQAEVSNGVTFSNGVEEEQDKTFNPKTSQELAEAKKRLSLSQSAKAWDLDGDGELDEAELALRKLDKSRRGTLSKEQIYELMSENLQTQRDLFKTKKVVYGLVAFTCVLALCNLGTSFAAAYIAKDSKTQDDKLTSVATGNVLATDSSTTIFKVDKEFSERRHRERRLGCVTSNGGKNVNCSEGAFANGVLNIPLSQGDTIVKACQKGGSVTIEVTHDGGALVHHKVCPPTAGSISCPAPGTKVGQGGAAYCQNIAVPRGLLGTVIIAKADSTTYTVTNLVGAIGAACSSDTDCASNAVCEGTCKYKHGTSGCTTSDECAAHNECIGTYWGSNVCSCTSDDACDAVASTAAFTCLYRARSGTSDCGCVNHSDCPGVDAVCAHMCGVDMDDAPAYCTTQSDLDSMCASGETCSADPRADGESVRFCVSTVKEE